MSNSLEAKICVLGAQGVGKTSLVQRYVQNTFSPPTTASTIGASFLTKRVLDTETSTTVRLQIWDTAGQERFRSISKLYYRGASAVILVYSIIDELSFDEMGRWLAEVKSNLGDDVIVHVVGTKSDIVAQDPGARKVPFERCIAYVAEHLYPELASTPANTAGGWGITSGAGMGHGSANSNRSSGFWGQEAGWDVCHEISASSGEGIEEVFRVITRKLVDQRHKRLEAELAAENGFPSAGSRGEGGSAGRGDYFGQKGNTGTGSFRVGIGDKRRSWLGFPTPVIAVAGDGQDDGGGVPRRKASERCC